MTPSAAYLQSVAEQTEHHARSKTFSGSLLAPHLDALADVLERTCSTTLLDYGCGKAKPWMEDPSLPRELGLDSVALFDPCVPQFNDDRLVQIGRRYDIVVLSHVLFWIPLVDLREWVLPLIFQLAHKGVFIVETIGAEKKRILSDRDAHPRGLHAIDWIDLLLPYRTAGVDVHLITEYRGADGRIYAGRWKL